MIALTTYYRYTTIILWAWFSLFVIFSNWQECVILVFILNWLCLALPSWTKSKGFPPQEGGWWIHPNREATTTTVLHHTDCRTISDIAKFYDILKNIVLLSIWAFNQDKNLLLTEWWIIDHKSYFTNNSHTGTSVLS